MDLLNAVLSYIDIPAVVLLILLGAFWSIVKASQARPDFDFSNMLKDDAGKESAMRLGIFVSLAISSWVVIYDTIHNKAGDSNTLLIYMAVWSGAKVAEKLVDALSNKWTVAAQPSVTQPNNLDGNK